MTVNNTRCEATHAIERHSRTSCPHHTPA